MSLNENIGTSNIKLIASFYLLLQIAGLTNIEKWRTEHGSRECAVCFQPDRILNLQCFLKLLITFNSFSTIFEFIRNFPNSQSYLMNI